MKKWVVGLDLGGTQIRALRTDLDGAKAARAQQLTEAKQGTERVLDRIQEMIAAVLEGVDRDDVLGIGIGAPGPIDRNGRVYDPPNLPGWDSGVSLTEKIAGEFNLPTYAGNDANVAALGERRFGSGKGLQDLIYMTISTGIGGGIISAGKLLTGWRGFAAEIGHQTLEPDGPLCGCGRPGHLEALASGTAIARDAQAALQSGSSSIMTGMADSIQEITAETVTLAAKQGDSLAIELIERAAFYIGLGLVNLIHTLEPQAILLGGGVSQAGELLMDQIQQTVRERVMSEIYNEVELRFASLGDEIGLYGAIALVMDEA
jgi:glucokinase